MRVSSSNNCQVWDEVAQQLQQNGGVASVPLSLIYPESKIPNQEKIWNDFFQVARHGMNHCKQHQSSRVEKEDVTNDIPWIGPNDDSAHVTGWHSAGCENPSDEDNSLSRYNQYREGFIFSDGKLFDLDLSATNSDINFQNTMEHAFNCLHNDIAQKALSGIARSMKITEEEWFQQHLGPTDNSSQWHVKRYVSEHPTHKSEKSKTERIEKESDKEILPMHTDPSLLSIVIHDVPGISSSGYGLQYLSHEASSSVIDSTNNPHQKKSSKKTWKNIPAHGHGIATIFTGSVLSLVTGGYFPAACHRVIQVPSSVANPKGNERMAVTLFVRPNGKSMLQIPPSPLLESKPIKLKNMTFHDWNAKVSRNYMKNKQRNRKRNDTNSKIFHESSREYFKDDYTELSILTAKPTLTGREKYLGGELGNNGMIYTIPGHAKQVLCINPNTSEITPLGPKYEGEFKWLRAVKVPTSGAIYGIPCHSNSILKIEPENGKITTFGQAVISEEINQDWKWHGGVYSSHDGCIYCIPQFAERVLKIDPSKDDEVSLIGPKWKGRNKWYGGLLGSSDGAIYGIPQNAGGVIRIDPKTQEVTMHGDYGEGGYKWHGGVIGRTNGAIYGIPAHSDRVLKIIPGPKPKLELIGNELRTGSHRNDGKYKFLGAVCGSCPCDVNNVYLFPSDTDYVVQINTETDVVREIGPSLVTLERIRQNKWQNGFVAPDGVIYGIPLKSESILRIRPRGEGEEPEVTTIGGPFKGLNKWEGGVMAMDGSMYCMPLNHRGVLRMRPLGTMND